MCQAVLVGLGAAFCVGCSLQSGNSCFSAYVLHAPGHTITNSCAGAIPNPMRFSVVSGQRFHIDIGHEESGTPDFPAPVPSSSSVRVVDRRGTTVAYQADRPGVTSLIARNTPACAHPARRRVGSCPAAVVTVTAR